MNKAAAALNYTPSNVSQQVMKLERELDCLLIDRLGSGVRLTPAGSAVVATAHRILAELETMEAEVARHRSTISDHLTLAAFPTAARSLAVDALLGLAAAHPGLRISVYEVQAELAGTLLTQGEADVAICHRWQSQPPDHLDHIQTRQLGSDTVDVMAAADHRLAQREEITIADLRGENWIQTASGSIHDEWLRRKYLQYEVEPGQIHRVNEFATQLAFVEAGLGLALLPRLGRGLVSPRIRALSLRDAPRREIFVAWRGASSERPAIAATVSGLTHSWSRLQADDERGVPAVKQSRQ